MQSDEDALALIAIHAEPSLRQSEFLHNLQDGQTQCLLAANRSKTQHRSIHNALGLSYKQTYQINCDQTICHQSFMSENPTISSHILAN